MFKQIVLLIVLDVTLGSTANIYTETSDRKDDSNVSPFTCLPISPEMNDHPSDCTKFIQCDHGFAHEKSCPHCGTRLECAGKDYLHFQRRINSTSCIWPRDSPCGNFPTKPQLTTTENPQSTTTEDQQSPTAENPESPTTENPESPTTENQQSPTTDNPESPTTENPESPTTENQQSPTTDNQQSTTENQQSPTIDDSVTTPDPSFCVPDCDAEENDCRSYKYCNRTSNNPDKNVGVWIIQECESGNFFNPDESDRVGTCTEWEELDKNLQDRYNKQDRCSFCTITPNPANSDCTASYIYTDKGVSTVKFCKVPRLFEKARQGCVINCRRS